ncbi:hypothetical protein ABKN59_008565 [Abortiporus biennis]
MHLVGLNLPEILLGLWRATLYTEGSDKYEFWDWAVLRGDIWEKHGRTVASLASYLPGSFYQAPRNPALKMNSGYKAWEFLVYLFVLGPAVFRGVLPDKYWRHFCRLVAGIRVFLQHRIQREQLLEAHLNLVQFVEEYELLYYQRNKNRLHFCRQSIHLLIHVSPETHRIGPPALHAQWTMETAIGNLTREIRQDSNPFANLMKVGLCRAQINGLKASFPELEPDPSPPRGSSELGDGYILLRARERTAHAVQDYEIPVFRRFFQAKGFQFSGSVVPKVTRWARLHLPNGQIARSAWKEYLKPLSNIRMSRMVKVQIDGYVHFAEVKFYFALNINNCFHAFALVAYFGEVDHTLAALSHNTLLVYQCLGNLGLDIISVKNIKAVVAMPPLPLTPQEEADEEVHPGQYAGRVFLAEKPGLEIFHLGGNDENDDDDTSSENAGNEKH